MVGELDIFLTLLNQLENCSATNATARTLGPNAATQFLESWRGAGLEIRDASSAKVAQRLLLIKVETVLLKVYLKGG